MMNPLAVYLDEHEAHSWRDTLKILGGTIALGGLLYLCTLIRPYLLKVPDREYEVYICFFLQMYCEKNTEPLFLIEDNHSFTFRLIVMYFSYIRGFSKSLFCLSACLPENAINGTCLFRVPFNIFQPVPFMVKSTVIFHLWNYLAGRLLNSIHPVESCTHLIGLSKERPILDHHAKAHIHEIRWISWNLADFVRISQMKSAGFRKTNCQEW